MLLNTIIVFLSAFVPGILVNYIPLLKDKNFRIILAFSGAYLFSTTIIHILPELFSEATSPTTAAIFVLLGFFLQMVLEHFTQGVEHGHMHVHHHDHNTEHIIPFSLIVSLCFHSFLEGMILVHPSSHHAQHNSLTIMLGLIVHKVPEAFALMSIMVLNHQKRLFSIFILILFSVASPLGMIFSQLVQQVYNDFIMTIFALVAGNFLYISTTIFFETSPEHKFKANRLIVSLIGATLAVIAQFYFH